MSDPNTRPERFAGADPSLDLPPVLPTAEAVAFPAVTSEGLTPLRVPAMSREEAARRVAEIEAASRANPSSTPISVRMTAPAPAVDAVDVSLRVGVIIAVGLILAAMAWGVMTMVRGVEGRVGRVELSAPN